MDWIQYMLKVGYSWDLTAPTQGRHVRGLRDGGDRLERGSRDIQDVEETEHN